MPCWGKPPAVGCGVVATGSEHRSSAICLDLGYEWGRCGAERVV